MMKRRLLKGIIFLSVLIFLMLVVNEPVIAAPTLPIVDGSIIDGLSWPKDGVPDDMSTTSIVSILDVDRPSSPFESRGIIEFELPSLSGPFTSADLVLTVFNSMGPYPFTIDVFTYTGDGLMSLGDFDAGSLFTSFAYSGEPVVTLDVTSFIGSLYTSGDDYAGFNFQFSVPTTIPMNGPSMSFRSLEHGPAAKLMITPTIEPIPAPGAVVLTSIGVGFIGWLRRRRAL